MQSIFLFFIHKLQIKTLRRQLELEAGVDEEQLINFTWLDRQILISILSLQAIISWNAAFWLVEKRS